MSETTLRRDSKWRSRLDLLVTVGMLIVTAGVLGLVAVQYLHPRSDGSSPSRIGLALPPEPMSLDGAATRGNRAASIAIIVYSDFQCPYCGKFARETLPTFDRDYVQSGKVLLAFRNFPLESAHPFALQAAIAAACAGRQGRFWEMHDLLFSDQRTLEEPSLKDRASKLSLKPDEFNSCLAGTGAAAVRADVATGKLALVSGTPAIFVASIQPDGKAKAIHRFRGAPSEQALASSVDEILKRK